MGFAHPTTWKRRVSKAVIAVRQPRRLDRRVLLLAAARPAVDEVKAGAKQELLKQFKPAKIVHEGNEPLGRRSVPELRAARKDKGRPVRALEMVDASPYRTYAVTVVTKGIRRASTSRRRARSSGPSAFSKPEPVAAKTK